MPFWNKLVAVAALASFAAMPAVAGGVEGEHYRPHPKPMTTTDCKMGQAPDGKVYRDCGQGWQLVRTAMPRRQVTAPTVRHTHHTSTPVTTRTVVTGQSTRFHSTCGMTGFATAAHPYPACGQVVHRPQQVVHRHVAPTGLNLRSDTVKSFTGGIGYDVTTDVYGGSTVVLGGQKRYSGITGAFVFAKAGGKPKPKPCGGCGHH